MSPRSAAVAGTRGRSTTGKPGRKDPSEPLHMTTRHAAARNTNHINGILADEMGMGKTLCLLALVLETLDEGRKWAEEARKEKHHNSRIHKYSHSTLIIVPSAC